MRASVFPLDSEGLSSNIEAGPSPFGTIWLLGLEFPVGMTSHVRHFHLRLCSFVCCFYFLYLVLKVQRQQALIIEQVEAHKKFTEQ